MRELERRPLGAFAAVFYMFACVFYSIDRIGRAYALFAALAVFVFFLIVGVKSPFSRVFTVISTGALAAAILAGYAIDVELVKIEALQGTEREISGVISDVRYSSSWEGCYVVGADGMDIILYSDNGELRSGDSIRCMVCFDTLESVGDSREYMLSSGIVLSAETVGEITVTGRGTGLMSGISALRETLSARLRSVMPEEAGGFSVALILGDRGYLAENIARDFRALGISHVLALSGTHLTALFAVIGRMIPSRRRYLRFVLLCPAVLFYIALTGFSSSVVRAGIMFVIASAAGALNKEADSFTSLSVSVLLICLVNPFAPYDVGLQLSFVSVMGLVFSGELEQGSSVPRMAKKLLPAFVVPATVLPLMWLRFGEVSLVSPAANILLVPVASVFIPVLGLLIVLSFFPAVFIPMGSAVGCVISLFLKLTEFVAELFDAVLPLRGTAVAVTLVLFMTAIFGGILCYGRLRRVCVMVSVIFLMSTLFTAQLYASDSHKGMTVCYVSKKSDEALCIMSDGYTAVVDMGRYPSAVKTAAELGALYGSGRIDGLVFTHLHQSHILTLETVCDAFYVDSIWLPTACDTESQMIADRLADEAQKNGVSVFTYIPGEKLYFGECEFETPQIIESGYSSHTAVEFTLTYGDESLTYASSELVSEADVRIVGVHGPEPRGVYFASDVEYTVVSTKCAAMLDAVADGTFLSDSVIVSFRDDRAPVIKEAPEA